MRAPFACKSRLRNDVGGRHHPAVLVAIVALSTAIVGTPYPVRAQVAVRGSEHDAVARVPVEGRVTGASVVDGKALAAFPDCNNNGTDDAPNIAGCPPGGLTSADCNANGVPDDQEVGWQLQSVLLAADGAATDLFGAAVAAHGDLVVAGARWEDANGIDSGSAYVFRRTGQTWTQEGKLVGSDTVAGDLFGYAVAVNSGTIVVGAFAHSDIPPYSGAVYVFEYDGLAWSEQVKLLPPDLQARDNFGASVAILGDLLVVGAPRADLGCDYVGDSGAAYVFRREASGWVFLQKLTASDAFLNDSFGTAVALAGNIIVVGAHQEGHTGPAGSWWDGRGAAYVFEWSGSTWEETAKLRASNLQTFSFGHAVAATTELVAVGAAGDTFGGIPGAGAVYVFERGPHGWHETKRLGAADATSYDLLGDAIAIQDNIVVASARADDVAGVASMAAYVFTKTEVGWVQEAQLFGSGVLHDGYFEGGVALSGATLVLGDTKDTTNGVNAGAVRVFYGFRNDCNANSIPDDCDIVDHTSADCDADDIPDECQPDCNTNGINDRCEIASLPSRDCNADGVLDECQGDCNANGIPDPCDVLAGTSFDCQNDGISDDCQLTGSFQNVSEKLLPIHARHQQIHEISHPPLAMGDVTLTFIASAELSSFLEYINVAINGTPVGKVFDVGASDCPSTANTDMLLVPPATFNTAVAGGHAAIEMFASPDVTPGVCERPYIIVSTAYVTQTDCNANGVPDECDISSGASPDCQPNGIPDECEADCNANGVADACDISGGTSNDCQPNAIPDECDIATGASEDCTGNGVPDECDQDCNENGMTDLCEILNDPAKDCDGDGILDECILSVATWTLIANDPAPNEAYGDPVAMSGDVLVVGSVDAYSSWVEAGAAYVYRFNGVEWKFEQTLLPENLTPYDSFGRGVAVYGDTIFVGAVGVDGAATSSGAVYVFRKIGGAWEQVSRLIPCDGGIRDSFGFSIAAEADLLVVGSLGATGSGDSQGAAYVYERIADEWMESARLVSPDGRDGENFGLDVAVIDGSVVVGSPIGFTAGPLGSVYVFGKIGDDWTSVAQLDPPAGDNALAFGAEVAAGDGMILVGARGEDAMGVNSGATYIFKHNGADWTPSARLSPAQPSPNALFGMSISVAAADRVVIASRRTAPGDGECMANVYHYEDFAWTLSAQYIGSSAPAPREYRCSVASLAQTVALGDTRDDSGGEHAGAVFVFADYENDCNGTGSLDTCDIADGTSNDLNQNGIPDECDWYSIPTTSEWGLVVMSLLLLVTGAVTIMRSRAATFIRQ